MIPRDFQRDKTLKPTATRFAKGAVLILGEGAFYWREKINADGVTEVEVEAINTAINVQWYRVRKFLGLDPLRS